MFKQMKKHRGSFFRLQRFMGNSINLPNPVNSNTKRKQSVNSISVVLKIWEFNDRMEWGYIAGNIFICWEM